MVTAMMEYNDFQKTEQRLADTGFSARVAVPQISLPNTHELLKRGLIYACGRQDIVWEDGYNDIAAWMADNKRKGLLVIGNCGLGKSIICTKVLPIVFNHYLGLMLHTYRAQNINQTYEKALKSKLTCVDDIGLENEVNIYGDKRLVLSDIVDNAERNGNLLILTTNLSTAALERKYGTRTIDRLRGLTKIVVVHGSSNRK